MVWYVRDAQCREFVTPSEANEVIEEFFLNQAKGQILTGKSGELLVPSDVPLHVKVGGDMAHGVYGFKAHPAGARYLIVLYELETGLSAMIEGRWITELRTGAVTAVATKYMAREEATTVGIVGVGREARQQLVSMALVRNLTKVWCSGRTPDARAAFAAEMTERLGIEVIPVDSSEDCVRDADIVTDVNLNNPGDYAVLGSWLRSGTHINVVGATNPIRRELDIDAVKRCGTIAVEQKDLARENLGELIQAAAETSWQWDQVHELSEIVTGVVPGRRGEVEITLADMCGLGAEDIALAGYVLRKARDLNIGAELDLEPPYNFPGR